MNIEDDSLYELIVRSFSNQLNPEESERMNVWINSDPANKSEYHDYLEIWKRSNLLQMSSEIDVQESLKKTIKSAGIYRTNIKLVPVLIQVAAVFILALVLSVLYNKFLTLKPQIKVEAATYQQVKATYGTQSRIDLPDGTVVYLNSGSSLSFPYSFQGMKTRKVKLTGEGYFTVKKNKDQPFIVDINKIQIKVLGTTFNVNAYTANSTFSIALIEGSVQINKSIGNEVADVAKMRANQVCIYNTANDQLAIKDENDLSKYIAWTQGKIVFYNDDVNTVIEKLENWYNVNIEIADKRLENYRFTGTFIDEPIEQILNILSMTSRMQYKIYPTIKLTDNTYSKRKIILKSK